MDRCRPTPNTPPTTPTSTHPSASSCSRGATITASGTSPSRAERARSLRSLNGSSRPRRFARSSASFASISRGSGRTSTCTCTRRGTPFQQAVWQALLKIPYGQTRSYGDIARAVGRPTAVRAVGLANGRNPLPIVVPCHRVIGAGGNLVGYGGGLHVKQALLDREREVSAARRTRSARRRRSS